MPDPIPIVDVGPAKRGGPGRRRNVLYVKSLTETFEIGVRPTSTVAEIKHSVALRLAEAGVEFDESTLRLICIGKMVGGDNDDNVTFQDLNLEFELTIHVVYQNSRASGG